MGQVLTIDAKLEVGAISTTLEVSCDGGLRAADDECHGRQYPFRPIACSCYPT